MTEKIQLLKDLLTIPERTNCIVNQIEDTIGSLQQFKWLIDKFPKLSRIYLARTMKLKVYAFQNVIMTKGDASDSYILILEGSLMLYNSKYADDDKQIRQMGPGEGLGELGIINDNPRSLTAVSLGCSILSIDAQTFQKSMRQVLANQLTSKIGFISKLFPKLEALSQQTREKVAFSCKEFVAQRGQVLAKSGDVANDIQIVYKGECIVKHKAGKNRSREITKIGPSGSFGEEGVFEDKTFDFDIIWSKDDTIIYRLHKVDIIRNFPKIIIKQIRKNSVAKRIYHKILEQKQNKRSKELEYKQDQKLESEWEGNRRYAYASPSAIMKLKNQESRRKLQALQPQKIDEQDNLMQILKSSTFVKTSPLAYKNKYFKGSFGRPQIMSPLEKLKIKSVQKSPRQLKICRSQPILKLAENSPRSISKTPTLQAPQRISPTSMSKQSKTSALPTPRRSSPPPLPQNSKTPTIKTPRRSMNSSPFFSTQARVLSMQTKNQVSEQYVLPVISPKSRMPFDLQKQADKTDTQPKKITQLSAIAKQILSTLRKAKF